jgi:peptide/nickel transport system permease protein
MTTKTATDTPAKIMEIKRQSFWFDLFKRMIVEKPLGTFGLFVVIALLLLGIFAPLIAPFGMSQIHLGEMLQGPSLKYPLGTDQLGRDILSRLIYGARISMIIGLGATIISQAESILIGIISGYFGGTIDLIIQRFVDAWMSLPTFLVLITLMSVLGSTNGGILPITLVIGITSGIGNSRIIRSAVIGIKTNTYMAAADAIGSGPIRTMIRHILPNILAPIIIGFTLGVGSAILAEASLSFLGLGVPPNVPSWGSMLSNEGRQYMERAPFLAFWPGLALSLAVFGINMFGDALRDLLDPRLRGGVGRYNISRNRLSKLKVNTAKH